MTINVLEFLEASAALYPDKTACRDENASITYAELRQNARAIGSFLAEIRERKRPVAVLTDRNLESVVMFLAVAYSGNFYVPIDKTLPLERIRIMLETLEPIAVLASKRDEALTLQLPVDRGVFYEDAIRFPENNGRLLEIRNSTVSTDPLCCIFTSGSTGVPKAVLKSHRSVIAMAENFTSLFGFQADDIFGNQASFDFDVSNKDIYISLKNGATVDILPKKLFVFPVNLISYMNKRKISVAIWAVSAMVMVCNLRAMKKESLSYMRWVLFSGESIPAKVLNYWMEHVPDAQYVNLYGPTEMTGNATYYKIDAPISQTDSVPIGKPFPNTGVLLLNENGAPAAQGEIGEICIWGECLATGYYRDMERTSKVFVQNPLHHAYLEIIYRTGDLGVLDVSGNYRYVSRKDFQIKHMGHRIELGDIEAAADTAEWVGRSCCLYDREHGKIVLFYEAAKERNAELAKTLESRLPRYMLPFRYVHFQRLPSNSHGKIDRKRLEAEYIQGK